MHRTGTPLALAALLLVAPGSSLVRAEPGKHLVRYGFKAGESFLVTTDLSVATTTSGNRQSAEMKLRDRVRVVSSDASKIVLEHECLANDAKIGYDLAPKEMRMMSRGQKARIETSPDGRVQRMVSRPFESYEEFLLSALPPGPVAVGESWRDAPVRIEVPNLGKLDLDGVWTLSQVKEQPGGRLAYLDYKGEMRDARRGVNARNEVRLVMDMASGAPTKMRVTNDLSCTVAGSVKLDLKVSMESAFTREAAAPHAAPAPDGW